MIFLRLVTKHHPRELFTFALHPLPLVIVFVLLILLNPVDCRLNKEAKNLKLLSSRNSKIKNYSANGTVSGMEKERTEDLQIQNSNSIYKGTKHEGFIKSAINYLLSTTMVRNYAEKIKHELSRNIEVRRQKMFEVGREGSYWMDSAMVPMAFITFAMFVLDILQRLFPPPGYGYGGYSAYGNYAPFVAPIKAKSSIESSSSNFASLFGRRSGSEQRKRKRRLNSWVTGSDAGFLNPIETQNTTTLMQLLNSLEKPKYSMP